MNGQISVHDVVNGAKLFDLNSVQKVDRSKSSIQVRFFLLTLESYFITGFTNNQHGV